MKISEIKNGNLNSVFKLNINKKFYIVRISDFNNQFESEVLNILKNCNINAPRIKTDFALDQKYIMIYDYIVGRHPINYGNIFFKHLIMEMKKIHETDINLIKTNNYNLEDIEKLTKYYNIAIKSEFLKEDKTFLTSLFIEVKKLPLSDLPPFLIHSDIKRENVLVNNKKVYIIDFGNCYIGNRLIDLIRIFMWFFIKEENYDFVQMKKIITWYFDNNEKINSIELQNIEILVKFCLLYNLFKDIYLYEKRLLPKNYIQKNSVLWLKALKDKEKLVKIVEVFSDVKRFTK